MELPKWMLQINLVDFIFINFTITMVLFSVLINFVEPYLPVFIRQSIRYGKFAYKGKDEDKVVAKMEVPKSWFKHFYVFAAVYSTLGSLLVFYIYFLNGKVPVVVLKFLDLVYGPVRTAKGKSSIFVLIVRYLRISFILQWIQQQH